MTDRINPAQRAEWTPEMRDFVAGFRSSVKSVGPDHERQAGDNLLGTLARYPNLAMAFLSFNKHLLAGSALSARQRELLILRVAHLRHADYEWAQHVILADRAGVTADEIERVTDGPDAPGWASTDRALVASVDDLLDEGIIRDETWTALAENLAEQQLMDVVFTVGCYAMLAMALRSFGIQPEPGLVPFLPRDHAR
ncbi:carboxymuconolactone decarboxylase family protein [Gordonia sp. SID5947]|uniref:carboxymuconolactone decarboxylase family protein n=1 Tax=Gordonia sp. SID5947 TaxID=2690315 RepID=UPI00136E77B3|nr:carboxymuconolactone decarboxylase family protein [Gordonia sp. SID5947]MYR06385.1 carboxymuconolactone decarboxylase family protein [Gordonia sp. SID5947]